MLSHCHSLCSHCCCHQCRVYCFCAWILLTAEHLDQNHVLLILNWTSIIALTSYMVINPFTPLIGDKAMIHAYSGSRHMAENCVDLWLDYKNSPTIYPCKTVEFEPMTDSGSSAPERSVYSQMILLHHHHQCISFHPLLTTTLSGLLESTLIWLTSSLLSSFNLL